MESCLSEWDSHGLQLPPELPDAEVADVSRMNENVKGGLTMNFLTLWLSQCIH